MFSLADPENVIPLFGFGGNAGMPIGPTAKLSGFGAEVDSASRMQYEEGNQNIGKFITISGRHDI